MSPLPDDPVTASAEVRDFFIVFHDGRGEMQADKWNGTQADVLNKARKELSAPGQHIRVYRAEMLAHYTLKPVNADE